MSYPPLLCGCCAYSEIKMVGPGTFIVGCRPDVGRSVTDAYKKGCEEFELDL